MTATSAVPSPHPAATPRRPSGFAWVPTAAGWIVGVIATLSLVASISPFVRAVIRIPREFVNDYIFNFPDTSFAWAFVLALLAAALAARKSIAWWILVLYMVSAAALNIADLVTGDETVMEDIGEIIGLVFHLASIGFLVLARHEFWAKVRRGALIKAVGTLVAGMAVGILIGWGLLELFPGSLEPDYRLGYAANRVVAFSGVDAEVFDGQHPGVLVRALLGLFGALALMVAAIVLFRSQRATNALTGEDESAIRGLLELYGKNDSLGYFATRRDKSVIFAPNGRAAITYRVEVGVCLASGDPVGDPRAWPAAIAAWLKLCESYGWAPGVMGASTTAAEAFREGVGFTGVSEIVLDGAVKGAPPLVEKGPEGAPVIPTKRGGLGELLNSAPVLLERLATLTERLTGMLSDRNQASIAGILDNTNRLTDALADRGPEIAATLAQTRVAIQQAGNAAQQIGELAQTTNGVMTRDVSPAMANLNKAIASAQQSADSLNAAIGEAKPGLTTFSKQTIPQINQLVRDLRVTAHSLSSVADRVDQGGAGSLIGQQKLPDYKGK